MSIPTAKPFFSEEDILAISSEVGSILRSGRLILGPYTQRLEKTFAEYVGVKHAIAVSSCTAALQVALNYFDIKDKEIIVPTNTFLATSNAVIYSGGTPVLADINPETLCIDPLDFQRRITSKTKGVIVVHVGGLPCPDIDAIQAICREKGLFLLEDVAHAHGGTINGKKTGSLGDAGCFSFYPTKVMTTCTGGMVTTDDDKLAEYAISLRHHGVGQGLTDIVNLGNDWLMDEISALLGIYQLSALETNLTRRNEIAKKYAGGLENVEEVAVFKVPSNIRHSYYKYPVLLPPLVDKRAFVNKMKSEIGIDLGSLYDPPCHLQPVYKRIYGFHAGMFPKAEATLERTCCLPMFVQMTDEEIYYVIKSFKEILPMFKANPMPIGA
jgi:perosamine synthetase